MNLKSNMLKILVVFALIMMIIPAIAAEDTAQDEEAVSESEDVVLSDVADDSSDTSADTEDEVDDEVTDEAEIEEAYAAGEPVALGAPVPAPSGFMMDLPAADLAVKITPEYQTAKAGDRVIWAASFINYGPDFAENAVGKVSLIEGKIFFENAFATYFNPLLGMDEPILLPDEYVAKAFDPVTGVFKIGEMAPGDIISLFLIGKALDDGEAILTASVSSDTYDPDLSNNGAVAYVNYAGGSAAAAEETLPATGNPIAMALLALISIVGLTFGRRL